LKLPMIMSLLIFEGELAKVLEMDLGVR
jgi:hypothetical protein